MANSRRGWSSVKFILVSERVFLDLRVAALSNRDQSVHEKANLRLTQVPRPYICSQARSSGTILSKAMSMSIKDIESSNT